MRFRIEGERVMQPVVLGGFKPVPLAAAAQVLEAKPGSGLNIGSPTRRWRWAARASAACRVPPRWPAAGSLAAPPRGKALISASAFATPATMATADRGAAPLFLLLDRGALPIAH
ncbi:MAG: hypothetical protein MUP33_04650 [Polaromonas sp.]|nr:hypothetical protein [Polaromonas sp.]